MQVAAVAEVGLHQRTSMVMVELAAVVMVVVLELLEINKQELVL
jgi:hypothetical protein